ncbi:MAG: hypothetical protein NXI04_08080 [Planctomycetaceae bacterium]|nr:hypothetical protein [Planctomycetaceae bacterium]
MSKRHRQSRRNRHHNLNQLPAAEVCESRTLLSAVNGTTLDAAQTQTSSELVPASINEEGTDAVIDWNNVFNDVIVADTDSQNPGYASRSMAMMNIAIYDAVAIASGRSNDTFYDYSGSLQAAGSVSAEVAASQAAYTVLSSLYPEQQAILDASLHAILADLPAGANQSAGRSLGAAIGNQVLAERADDGSDAVVSYTYSDEVGAFHADPLNPDVPVWGPGWGDVQTFAIDAAEDFAPETTPALTSEDYADSYNEVKELGAVDSTTRTADETEAGIYWAYDREGLGTPLSLYNDVIEVIARQEGNSLEENAALFAQTSVAMADAAIVAWHTKFDEEFWRPVTAIHDGELDGNPLTEDDDNWTALGAPDGGDDIIGFTPQFPTYISGHATFGGALFGSLQEFYGTDDIAFDLASNELSIIMDNPELEAAYGLDLDDAVRSFDTLSEAMEENGRSRVYLGIHFDFDDTVGQEVGQDVASAVSSEFVVATSGDMRMTPPGRSDHGLMGPRRDAADDLERRDESLLRSRDRGLSDRGPQTEPSVRGPAADDVRTNMQSVADQRQTEVEPQQQQPRRMRVLGRRDAPPQRTPAVTRSPSEGEVRRRFQGERREQTAVQTTDVDTELTSGSSDESLLQAVDRLFAQGIPGLFSTRRR